MNDLASHIFNTANAMNRAKAAELSGAIAGLEGHSLTGSTPAPGSIPDASSPKGRWDTPSEHKAEGFSALGVSDIAPHVVKIPLRAEVRDLLTAAKLYEEHADLLNNSAEAHEHYAKSNRAEAAKLEQLARDARAQSENLTRMANL